MKTLILIAALMIFMSGCVITPFQRYDDEMTRVAVLYEQGRITKAEKAKVIEYGETFWLSYNQSLDDLGAFLRYTRSLGRN